MKEFIINANKPKIVIEEMKLVPVTPVEKKRPVVNTKQMREIMNKFN